MLYSPVHVAIAEVGSVRSGHAGGPALIETVELAVGITLRAAHTDKNKCTNYLCKLYSNTNNEKYSVKIRMVYKLK